MVRSLLKLALFVVVLIVFIINFLNPKAIQGPKVNFFGKTISNKQLSYPFQSLNNLKVFSGRTLEEIKLSNGMIGYKFGTVEMLYNPKGKSSIKHFSTFHTTMKDSLFIQNVKDRVIAEDIRLLIETEYNLSVDIDSSQIKPTQKIAPILKDLMNAIGYIPKEFIHLDAITITNKCIKEGLQEAESAGFYSYSLGKHGITVDTTNQGFAMVNTFAHEWGHYLTKVTLNRDSSWWHGINSGTTETYQGHTKWKSLNHDSAYSGYLRTYSIVDWHEDISTMFELFDPRVYNRSIGRIQSDDILQKKSRATLGMVPSENPEYEEEFVCNACKYQSEFGTVAFIPRLHDDYTRYFNASFWKDLKDYKVISTPEQGWYWHKKRNVKSSSPPKKWWQI